MVKVTQKKTSGSLREKVFAELESAIINGEYKQGDTLNEIKLSEALGVSRTPVREALMQLELEGLVQTTQNKGAVVVGISKKDIEDIYAIRMLVEGFASELAAERISAEETEALTKLVDLQEFYLMKQDFDQIWQLDTEFHRLVYMASGNRPLKNVLTSLHNYIQHGRDLSLRANGRSEKAVQEHRAILDAIAVHDANKAGELTRLHIRNAYNNYMLETADE